MAQKWNEGRDFFSVFFHYFSRKEQTSSHQQIRYILQKHLSSLKKIGMRFMSNCPCWSKKTTLTLGCQKVHPPQHQQRQQLWDLTAIAAGKNVYYTSSNTQKSKYRRQNSAIFCLEKKKNHDKSAHLVFAKCMALSTYSPRSNWKRKKINSISRFFSEGMQVSFPPDFPPSSWWPRRAWTGHRGRTAGPAQSRRSPTRNSSVSRIEFECF